jgi:NADPH:quinone reductase-like Zn-dependent oxidoreductase
MKLIQFREPGPPNVLQCLDVPVPEPKPDEVLIRAHAIGVGMPDVLIRAGTYNFMPPLPATPGQELSGTIEKIGVGVTTRRPGQRVYASARERPHRGGHYAEFVVAPADRFNTSTYSKMASTPMKATRRQRTLPMAVLQNPCRPPPLSRGHDTLLLADRH